MARWRHRRLTYCTSATSISRVHFLEALCACRTSMQAHLGGTGQGGGTLGSVGLLWGHVQLPEDASRMALPLKWFSGARPRCWHEGEAQSGKAGGGGGLATHTCMCLPLARGQWELWRRMGLGRLRVESRLPTVTGHTARLRLEPQFLHLHWSEPQHSLTCCHGNSLTGRLTHTARCTHMRGHDRCQLGATEAMTLSKRSLPGPAHRDIRLNMSRCV